MTKAFQVQVTARETVTPSCPTPHHLRNFKLSFLDQISPPEYAAIVLFYAVNGDTDHHRNVFTSDQISQRLKSSLSEALTKFYPFAGKIKDHVSIECSDDGVEYVEARSNCLLFEFLQEPDQELLREFLPISMESPQAATAPLLIVQATFFKCGGVAIGICTSHKLVDGCSVSIFVKSWAATALDSVEVVLPEYVTESVFPPDESLLHGPHVDASGVGYVTKRFVFDASKIAELRAKVASASVPKPTRIEALTALIWKCAMTVSRSNRGFSRLSMISQAMNLRRMVVPPLPDNSVGNIVGADTMTGTLQVKKVAREAIIPSYPTPHHLRNFKLSFLDQISPAEYTGTVLFYTVNGDTDHHDAVNADKISQRLKSSLSENLTKFYPFAGKIKDHVSIECNDDGVEYVEAQANCLLSEFLQEPDQKLLREFLPIQIESPKASTGPLILVQATFFKCEGVAIGICTSHKLMDGSTISIFINSWAATAFGAGEAVVPEYVVESFFPPDESLVPRPHVDVLPVGYVTKRFVFDASKIGELRAKVASASVPKPTRVEAVTALIWKCNMTVSRSNRGFSRLSLLVHAMNLRGMIVPSLPDNSVGNVVGYFSAQTRENEIELQDLVCLLRKGKEEFSKKGLETMLEYKSIEIIPELKDKNKQDQIDFYIYSSWSGFPLYEANFGWGKPIWVSMPDYTHKKIIMLLGTKDGEGIEALVTLSAEDMALFEREQELLAFATYNPAVLLHTANGSQ
ncbi:Vinorine synthase-like [Melia azedarach]|uniref:Vinorine synthase-like n=1 Tax=Melia azedarach TaxID=155640 RepID=A0ACC1X6W9_MELAZ|nr:Vinorine synthase-like [Melia azedarach]